MKYKRNNQYWQQKEERFIIDPLLDELGIPEENRYYTDKPDVLIEINNKKVGIEITQIKATQNKETASALNKLFNEYNEHLKTLTRETFQIGVIFMDVNYPNNINLTKNKEQIFKEIDSFLPNAKPILLRHFIDEAIFLPSPGCETFTSEVVALEFTELSTELLQRTIQKKENKLKDYRKLNNCDEYWLVIDFPNIEQTDFRRFEEYNITSGYDRIYLVEIGNYKRIK